MGSKDQQGTLQSEVKRELLSSIGLFTGTGLLGFWFGVGGALSAKMVKREDIQADTDEGRASEKIIKWQKKIK